MTKCYACDQEAVYLLHKGWKERPVCEDHLEQLRKVGVVAPDDIS